MHTPTVVYDIQNFDVIKNKLLYILEKKWGKGMSKTETLTSMQTCTFKLGTTISRWFV